MLVEAKLHEDVCENGDVQLHLWLKICNNIMYKFIILYDRLNVFSLLRDFGGSYIYFVPPQRTVKAQLNLHKCSSCF